MEQDSIMVNSLVCHWERLFVRSETSTFSGMFFTPLKLFIPAKVFLLLSSAAACWCLSANYALPIP